MGKPRPTECLSEGALIQRIFDRFPRTEWATFSQIRNAAGFSASRTLDAVAINTWPSRGLEVHGFECKSSRGDWLREKDDPAKAEAFLPFCDRWWLVVGREDIVQPGELPPTWGLLAPRGKGLVAKVEAPKLEAKPLDRHLLAVILRRAAEPETTDEQKQAIQAAFDQGHEAGQKSAKLHGGFDEERVKRLEKTIADFEKASGLALDSWSAGRMGAAVDFVMRGGLKREEQRLRHLQAEAESIAAELREGLAALPEMPDRAPGSAA